MFYCFSFSKASPDKIGEMGSVCLNMHELYVCSYVCQLQSLRTSGDGIWIRDEVTVVMSSLASRTIFLSSNRNTPLLLGLYIAFPLQIIFEEKVI